MVVPQAKYHLFYYQRVFEREDGTIMISNVKHKRRPLAEVTKFFLIFAVRKWSIDKS